MAAQAFHAGRVYAYVEKLGSYCGVGEWVAVGVENLPGKGMVGFRCGVCAPCGVEDFLFFPDFFRVHADRDCGLGGRVAGKKRERK